MSKIPNIGVYEVLQSYPDDIRGKLFELRKMIYQTATRNPVIGEITETLKWGEPAYLTNETKSGSTIRLGWKPSQEAYYMMHFNCQTTLIDRFKRRYADLFRYDKNRSLVFHVNDVIIEQALCDCIEQALTYHLLKSQNDI